MNQTATLIAQQARGRALLFGLPVDESINLGLAESSENLSILQSELLRRPATEKLSGFGPLQTLLDDPTVEEIWINRPNEIWFATSTGNHSQVVEFSAQQIETVVERLLKSTGRRIDRTSPFVDAGLSDGSRLHIVIPTVTRANWCVNIRKFRAEARSLSWLQSAGMISAQQAQQLLEAVLAGRSILVSGATQAGKTTVLTALLNAVGEGQRIVTIEDTFEINCNALDLVAMQTRESTPEGVAAVDMRRLVRESLRMRPNRIVVGEVRGSEALDLLLAFNSGIAGFCTIHANSASEALEKLSSLPMLASANLSQKFARRMVQTAIGMVVHCERDSNGLRKVVEILEVSSAK